MAKHSYERGRWKRREARRRFTGGFPRPSWTYILLSWRAEMQHEDWIRQLQRGLNQSVHQGVSRYSRIYRRQWRHAGHEICRLHLLGDDHAEELDPQPRRLGVMWDIW